MQIRPNADTETLRERIFALLNAAPHDVSPELLNLLAQYWQKLEVYFGTKMEPWKAGLFCLWLGANKLSAYIDKDIR